MRSLPFREVHAPMSSIAWESAESGSLNTAMTSMVGPYSGASRMSVRHGSGHNDS